MSGSKAAIKLQIEQLKGENKLKREKTSITIKDMQDYIVMHQDKDVLVTGFKKKDFNPYKPKASCELV